MVKALILTLLFLHTAALAADVGCGRDTDLNGSTDRFCAGADADNDGYSTAQGDCDDNAWLVYPGISTASGCAAGQHRTCKADTTGWTACTSAAYCPTGDSTTHVGKAALACYYVDPVSGSDSTGTGSNASPWKTLRNFSHHEAGMAPAWALHTVVAGNAFIVKAGTISDVYTNTGFDPKTFWGEKNLTAGTPANPIWIIADPKAATRPILNPGNTGASMATMKLASGDNIIISGFEITGGYGDGIRTEDATGNPTDIYIFNNYIHNQDSNCASDNEGGIRLVTAPQTHRIHHNIISDNYRVATPTHGNCYNVTYFNGDGNEFTYNVIFNSNNTYGGGIKQKHANYTADSVIKYNYVFTVGNKAIETGGPNIDIKYNLIYNAPTIAISIVDAGGENHNHDINVQYNTIVNSGPIDLSPDESNNQNGTTAADICSGDSDIAAINVSYNVTKASVASPGDLTRFLTAHLYGPQALYNELIGALTCNSNCWYNSAGAQTWGLFENNNADTTCAGRASGTSYTTFATWQAAGFDAAGYSTDPQLDASYVAQTAVCEQWGYRSAFAPPPTPSVEQATSRGGTYSTGQFLKDLGI